MSQTTNVAVIQTDARSYFASCNACGDGVTTDRRHKAEQWAADHEKGHQVIPVEAVEAAARKLCALAGYDWDR